MKKNFFSSIGEGGGEIDKKKVAKKIKKNSLS